MRCKGINRIQRKERLKGRSIFVELKRKGFRMHSGSLMVFFLPAGDARFGITVSRKCGNAVQRNRIKRVMRETYRLNRDKFPGRGALLFLVKSLNDEDKVTREMFSLSAKLIERFAISDDRREIG